MLLLKQSTEVKVRIGCAVAIADGITPVTTLDLSAADEAELLKHNGAATVDISGAACAAIASCDGWYDLTLTTGHTDTLGLLTVAVNDDSLCLPIWHEFMVVPANVWDSLFGSDRLQVHAAEITAGLITAAAIASGAITAAKIAADAIDASALKADAVTEIVDGLKASTGWGTTGAESFSAIVGYLRAMTRGKVVASGNDLAVYDDDGSTLLFTITLAAGGRTVA